MKTLSVVFQSENSILCDFVALLEVQAKFPDTTVVCYLDDTYYLDEPSCVAQWAYLVVS